MAGINDIKGFINLMKQLAVQTAAERTYLENFLHYLENRSLFMWLMLKDFHFLFIVIGMAKKFEEDMKIKNDEKQEEEVKDDDAMKKIIESFEQEDCEYESWIKEIVSDRGESQETDLLLPRMHAEAFKLTKIYRALLEKLVSSLSRYNGIPREFKKFKGELERYILENKDIKGDFIVQLISVLVKAEGKVDDMEKVTLEVKPYSAACMIIGAFKQYALVLDWAVKMLYQQEEKEKGLHELHVYITAAMEGRE